MTNMRRRFAGAAPLPLALLGAGLILGTSACDVNKLLKVTDPAVATPESLADPAALPTLYVGALGDFQVAYSGSSDGNNEGFNTVSALLSDEMGNADTFTTRIATDQRTQQPVQNNNTSDASFNLLQRARHSTAAAADAIQAATGATITVAGANVAKGTAVANMKALEGMTYVALGEGFCGAVPFSDVVNGEYKFGEPLTTAQIWDEAIKRFDAALTSDAASNLAKVAKGRALLDKGDFAGAAAAVASVPDNYFYLIEHSDNSGRQYNPMYSLAASNGRYTVQDKEGGKGLPFRTALDPRVPWAAAGTGFDKSTPLYADLRYPTYGSSMPLASGVEARLIEAEAALKAGDAATWLSKLNGLRSQFSTLMPKLASDWANQIAKTTITARSLDPLTDPGTADARLALMFQERGFWLYTTGHRLGDLRRLVRQYGKAQADVFPSGPYFKGGSFGSDVAFPIPFNEQQNTLYKAKLSQCDVTKA